MALTAERTREIVEQFGSGEKNTGATPVQIAIMTERISGLTEHLRTNPTDFGSRRGLLKLIGRRRRLQTYYQREEPTAYAELIKKLGLRR